MGSIVPAVVSLILSMQGYQSGKIKAQPLAAAALGLSTASVSSGWVAVSHPGASITCLLEHSSRILDNCAGALFQSVLVAGSENGSVHTFDLWTGENLFMLSLHTAKVQTTLP